MDGTVRPDHRNERASGARYNGSVRRLLPVALLSVAVALAVAVSSCGGGGAEPQPAPPATSANDPASAPGPGRSQHQASDRHREGPRQDPGRGDRPKPTRAAVREAVAESDVAHLEGEQRAVARVVRAYVAALSSRDGGRACSLFAPGALSRIDLPRDRGGCDESLSASIGYRDPRGYPVYSSSRVARIPSVVVEGSSARVTATTVTRFAGTREPSVEDDLVYLREQDGRWLIAKPSATLYRAIGVGNIPPSVLAAP
jgi:hypothetical protein